MTILKDLSIGEADHSKLAKLIATQGALLKHAMRSESSSLVKKSIPASWKHNINLLVLLINY